VPTRQASPIGGGLGAGFVDARRTAGGKQQLLDRDTPVKQQVVAAPHPAHPALADRLVKPVAPADDRARPRCHDVMIRGNIWCFL
jgi:hypothetical protein